MSKARIRKTVDVDISETVSADIILRVSEIVDFIKECDDDEKSQILEALNMPTGGIKISTLEDVMKMETLTKLFHKYSSSQLDQFL